MNVNGLPLLLLVTCLAVIYAAPTLYITRDGGIYLYQKGLLIKYRPEFAISESNLDSAEDYGDEVYSNYLRGVTEKPTPKPDPKPDPKADPKKDAKPTQKPKPKPKKRKTG